MGQTLRWDGFVRDDPVWSWGAGLDVLVKFLPTLFFYDPIMVQNLNNLFSCNDCSKTFLLKAELPPPPPSTPTHTHKMLTQLYYYKDGFLLDYLLPVMKGNKLCLYKSFSDQYNCIYSKVTSLQLSLFSLRLLHPTIVELVQNLCADQMYIDALKLVHLVLETYWIKFSKTDKPMDQPLNFADGKTCCCRI